MYSTQKHFRYTEIAKPKKNPDIPKGNRQQPSAHHVAKTEEKFVFCIILLYQKAHYKFSPCHTIFVSNKIMLGFLLNCSLEHQQRLQLYIYRNKILINNLFFILGIYYDIVCILSPLYSLGHDWDSGETTLERWLGDL